MPMTNHTVPARIGCAFVGRIAGDRISGGEDLNKEI